MKYSGEATPEDSVTRNSPRLRSTIRRDSTRDQNSAWNPTFVDGFDPASDSAAMWTTMSRDDGHLLLHLLIRYIVDRRDDENRWVHALEKTDVPLAAPAGVPDHRRSLAHDPVVDTQIGV